MGWRTTRFNIWVSALLNIIISQGWNFLHHSFRGLIFCLIFFCERKLMKKWEGKIIKILVLRSDVAELSSGTKATFLKKIVSLPKQDFNYVICWDESRLVETSRDLSRPVETCSCHNIGLLGFESAPAVRQAETLPLCQANARVKNWMVAHHLLKKIKTRSKKVQFKLKKNFLWQLVDWLVQAG